MSAALSWWPAHHWSAGTRALTWAMWAPHPDQVVLLQVRQRTALHMEISSQAGAAPDSASSAKPQNAS